MNANVFTIMEYIKEIKKIKKEKIKMKYTTQMDAARKGIITKEMEIVSKKENMDMETLMERMAKVKLLFLRIKITSP